MEGSEFDGLVCKEPDFYGGESSGGGVRGGLYQGLMENVQRDEILKIDGEVEISFFPPVII